MPNNEDFHTRLSLTELSVKTVIDRHNTLEKRYLDDIHKISSAITSFEDIAEELKEIRKLVAVLPAIEARVNILEKAHDREDEGYVNLLLNYKVWLITTLIVLFAKYGMDISIATFNNK